jgi:hypothetical protein
LAHYIYIQLFVQSHVSINGEAGKKLEHQLKNSPIKLNVIESQPISNNFESYRKQEVGHLICPAKFKCMTLARLQTQVPIHKAFVYFIGRILTTPVINVFVQKT